MSAPSAGREGLQRMREALAKRPQKDGALLTGATKALCAYRDQLIVRSRSGHSRDRLRLERLNAVLSIVAGLHFPLGSPPWDEFAKALDWLSALLEEDAAGAADHTETERSR